MARTLGIFYERVHEADMFWNQCDGPAGRHAGFRLVTGDARADAVLSFSTPVSPVDPPCIGKWRRRAAKWRGTLDALRAEVAWSQLSRSRESTFAIFYEPPVYVSDEAYAIARRYCARVFGPDPRATDPITLPVTWLLTESAEQLRAFGPGEDRPIPLAAITSGKNLFAGHGERLGFLRRLRREGVPLELFGRSLPGDLSPRGVIQSKGLVLRAARFALVVENDAASDLYVTEKVWDALLSWAVPLYYGSRALDSLIPPEAFIRLPDLGDAGVETVKHALGDGESWKSRHDAIAEARRRALGDLRLVEWIRRTIPGMAG